MMNMEMLLNRLKKAKLRTPKQSYFEQYLYDIDDKEHWKNRKMDAIVNEFYAAKYELWNNRLIKRIFYVEQKWLNKEKQYCNIYEVQRFLAGSNKKLSKWIYSASYGGVRPQWWERYDNCEWEINPIDRMVCAKFYNSSRDIHFYNLNSYEYFLKQSIQKFSGFEFSGLYECELFWYLHQYEKHPQMEMISKMGLMGVVIKSMNCLKWSQKGYRLLGIESKDELESVRMCSAYGGLKYYRKHKDDIKRFKIDTKHKLSIYDVLYNRKFPVSVKLINYINDNDKSRTYGTSAHEYIDYIKACQKLAVPLTSAVRYPENLQKAHDDMTEKVEANASKIETERIQKQVIETYGKYRYADDHFVITPANSSADLINESRTLNHCVRTYIERYANAKTAIFLIRKRDDVMTPFYTLELKNKKVHQVRGSHNCDPTDEVKNFVMEWCKRYKLDSKIYQKF